MTAPAPATRRRPACRTFGRDPRSRDLADRIVDRGRAIAALHAEQLVDVAELDRLEGWRGDGAVSMASWLSQQCRVGASTARTWARSAARLAALPALAGGLAAGELTLDLVAPLAEVATPETDAVLAASAGDWSVQQARELAVWHKAVRDAAARQGDARAAARDYERRSLHFNDVACSMWAAFTKEDYAEAKAAIVAAVGWNSTPGSVGLERRGDGGRGDTVGYVPLDQRLYDGLMDLFRVGCRGRNGELNRSQPRVIVHVPLDVLLGMGRGQGVAEIEGVGPIPTEVVRRLACEASITVSVEGSDGRILDQGRARKEPSSAQRIEIARRDKGCRFPGCPHVEFTHLHHMVHWADGGRTDLANLITLCGRHHRAVHELGWKMAGDANTAVSFTSPTGRRMRSVPSPTWRIGPAGSGVGKSSRLRR